MKLYEIDQKITELIDPETGELQDYEAFAELQMERDAKVESMGLWVKDLEAESKAIKDEVENLMSRKAALDKKSENLKSYLAKILQGSKFKTPRLVVSFRQSVRTEIEDENALLVWLEDNGHDDCIKYKAPDISKAGVKAIMKSGVLVPGARLVDVQSVSIK